MSGRLFGTDGVRGLANGLLTAELATNLGVAAAQVLGERGEFSSQIAHLQLLAEIHAPVVNSYNLQSVLV